MLAQASSSKKSLRISLIDAAQPTAQDHDPSIEYEVTQPDPLDIDKEMRELQGSPDGAGLPTVSTKFFHSRLGNNTLRQLMDQ